MNHSLRSTTLCYFRPWSTTKYTSTQTVLLVFTNKTYSTLCMFALLVILKLFRTLIPIWLNITETISKQILRKLCLSLIEFLRQKCVDIVLNIHIHIYIAFKSLAYMSALKVHNNWISAWCCALGKRVSYVTRMRVIHHRYTRIHTVWQSNLHGCSESWKKPPSRWSTTANQYMVHFFGEYTPLITHAITLADDISLWFVRGL